MLTTVPKNPFDDELRTRIRRRLRLVGPGPASAYEDAFHLMYGDQCAQRLNTLPHLIGHLFRETESALRAVLDPQPGQRGNNNEGHKAAIERVLAHLNVAADSPLHAAWMRFANDESRRLPNWAHRNNLKGPKFPRAELESLFTDFELVLDGVLEAFEAHYLKYQSRVDELLRKDNPTKADVAFLQQHAPHDDVTFQRFFRNVSNPAWLPLLKEAGYLRAIPAAVRDGDRVSLPAWLPVLALQSLAKVDPEAVADVLDSLEETDNDWVSGHLMDVALSLPPALAVKWSTREARRIAKAENVYLWLPLSCRKMVEYLAKEGEIDAALDLAKAILGLRSEPDTRPSIEQALGVKRKGERKMTVMKIGRYEYEEIAKTVVEELTPRFGIRIVQMFSELLEYAIRHDGYEKEPQDDHSYIWRPAIGDSERNYRGEAHQSLVTPLRDAALYLAEHEATNSDVIQYLLERDWQVHWRVAMYVAASRMDPGDPALLAVLDAKQWGDRWYGLPEYFDLLRKAFMVLSDDEKMKRLDWVERFPNLEGWKGRFKEQEGRDANADDIEDYKAYRGIRALWRIRDILPKPLAEKYEQWTKRKTGQEAEALERMPKGAYSVGGPKQQQDIAEMTVPEVLTFLRDWKPEQGIRSTTHWAPDLARNVSDDVKTRRGEYLQHLDDLLAMGDPTWCAAVVSGLRDANLKAHELKVLIPFFQRLSEWGPGRKSPKAAEFPDSDFATSMAWCRMAILTVVKQSLRIGDDNTGLPKEYRDTVWQLVRELLNDPDPMPEKWVKRGETPDFANMAINSVRSEALQAAIDFGIWWVCNAYPDESARERRGQQASVMGEIPGLVEVLDRHLSQEHEHHPAVWSVYGTNLTRLILLGRDWVDANLPKLFPDDDMPPMRRTAVWTSFIRYYRANMTANVVLRGQFVKETQRLRTDETDKDPIHQEANTQLAIHLMIMYWWREVSLDEPPLSACPETLCEAA